MDLPLFWAVVRRFKRIAIGGTILAAVLAGFAYKTPALSGHIVYQSQAQLLISQADNPYGRAANEYLPGAIPGENKTAAVVVGDPSYMSKLSPVYAALANSDIIRNAVRASRIPGTITAAESVDPVTGNYTPLFSVTASASSASDAISLSKLAVHALQTWLAAQQAATGTAPDQRVILQVLQNGIPPTEGGHKPTVPILLFVAVLAGTIVLLLSLENRDRETSNLLGRIPAPESAAIALQPSRQNGKHAVADFRRRRTAAAPAQTDGKSKRK